MSKLLISSLRANGTEHGLTKKVNKGGFRRDEVFSIERKERIRKTKHYTHYSSGLDKRENKTGKSDKILDTDKWMCIMFPEVEEIYICMHNIWIQIIKQVLDHGEGTDRFAGLRIVRAVRWTTVYLMDIRIVKCTAACRTVISDGKTASLLARDKWQTPVSASARAREKSLPRPLVFICRRTTSISPTTG